MVDNGWMQRQQLSFTQSGLSHLVRELGKPPEGQGLVPDLLGWSESGFLPLWLPGCHRLPEYPKAVFSHRIYAATYTEAGFASAGADWIQNGC